MPELVETDVTAASGVRGRIAAPSAGGASTALRESPERLVRRDLRRQIIRLERELGELFASAFPRRGIQWDVAPAGGPRVLGIEDLEVVRDSLVARLQVARGELAGRANVEQRYRELLEDLIVSPERYRWVRVSNEHIGEPGCRHWHSKPRWGLLGMLMGWWRVKLSSGCPLPPGRGLVASRPNPPGSSGPPL